MLTISNRTTPILTNKIIQDKLLREQRSAINTNFQINQEPSEIDPYMMIITNFSSSWRN